MWIYEICFGYYSIFGRHATRRKPVDVSKKISSRGDIYTVPPVVAEIQYGIKRLNNSSKKSLLLKSERDRLLSVISVLPWKPESSKYFGIIKADLERQGKLIDDFDIAIAAIARSHKCGVVTSNLSHFSRIEILQSVNWK
jgi:tRNA(fMet)-specific endonuclease VapC